jgi:hypothetical protein
LNHRHADFQSRVVCGSSMASGWNCVKLSLEEQRLSAGLSNSSATSDDAARWLLEHREERAVRILPTLKERFGLLTYEAISAAQMAHPLQCGGRT